MRINTRRVVKAYYTQEVSNKEIPYLPEALSKPCLEKKKSGKDSLFLAAMLFASLTVISLPPVYESQLRKTYIPRGTIEAFKKEFPRVLFDASVQYKESKGV
jgi:hypothetical protein